MAQEWKKNEHYVVPALRFVFIKCFIPFSMFRRPTLGAQMQLQGLWSIIRSWCKLVGVKAGRCKNLVAVVRTLVSAKASGVKAIPPKRPIVLAAPFAR